MDIKTNKNASIVFEIKPLFCAIVFINTLFFIIKDALPVFFRSELFTSYIVTIFKQRNILL